ncbi:MAG: [FeFe] hydrogenase H-cluster maturation GTPase HydF [Ruminococcus sp.]|nr:[FeFe] hydrogenase H-cluster maturation GTPase HydF [Ruminococcus sp.]
MSLNDTPSGERVHIGFFGRRNAGKSSVVNAVTGQELAVVSDRLGTTTDPVYKAMEILPMGPVMIIDTPGFDDEGELGALRVKKTRQVLNRTDCAVLVCDCTLPLGECEKQLISLFEEKKVPYIIAWNKCDLLDNIPEIKSDKEIYISAKDNTGINALREKTAGLIKSDENSKRLVGDIINAGDIAVLVVPIDGSAPKGRLILPQQQAIRDILESSAVSVVVKDTELKAALEKLGQKPAVVITDSQAFGRVSRDVPEDIKLTSFSILMARYKGFLETAVKGAAQLDRLNDGDRILISEGCTHHRQCEDIGTVKLPKWLMEYTGKSLEISTTSGREFPEDLTEYALVIHCGGCMLNGREMLYRMKCAEDQGVAFTNYGIAIAHINGILKRSLEVFPDLYVRL